LYYLSPELWPECTEIYGNHTECITGTLRIVREGQEGACAGTEFVDRKKKSILFNSKFLTGSVYIIWSIWMQI